MQNRNNFGILLVSGALALSAIGVALLTQNLSGTTTVDDAGVIAVEKTLRTQAPTNTDTDGDGLPNWKEILYKTDPTNPDTDGDGVSDYDEIEQKSDPLVFGTDVALKTYIAPRALAPSDALARELFSSYAGEQSNLLSKTELEYAIEEMVQRQGTVKEPPIHTYDLSEIQISKTLSMSTYIGAVSQALNKAQQVREYELSVFARAVEKGGGSDLEKLRSAAAIYRSIQNELVAMPVPEKISTEHVIFINSMEAFIVSIEQLANWNGDPFTAIVLIGKYGDAEDAMVQDMSALFSQAANLEVHT